MIIRKPFKFLIEHFKIINVILILLTSFVAFKFFNIMQFFGDFVTNSYTTTQTDLASNYIGILLPITIIAIILINIIIFILFKSKDKDTKIYLISTISFAVLLVFTFIYRGVLDNFEFNTVESQTALLYRDTSKFTFYPIFLFIIFYFLNFVGFDLTTFEFTNLRDDIDIAKEDDAEIEIGVQIEDYKLKRTFFKKLRELKYYIVDNKLVFMGIGGTLTLGLIILIISTIVKLNNNVRVDKSFTYSNFAITVENSYLTKLDYGGNKLSDKYHYLVLVLSVTNKSKTPKALDTDNFWLQIGKTYIYPILDKSTYFKDLGEPYYKDKIEVGKTHKYILCYSILDKEISNSYSIKILDSVKYVDGVGTPTYKTLKVSPKENDKIIDNGDYSLGEEINLSKSTLKNTIINVRDYNISDTYTYEYNYCNKDNECSLKKNAISNNSNTKKTLIALNSNVTFDTSSNYSMYGQNDFYNNFVTFEYVYNDETYTSSVTDKSASNDIAKNKVLEVDYNMKYASSIKMIITIRNQRYTISLL